MRLPALRSLAALVCAPALLVAAPAAPAASPDFTVVATTGSTYPKFGARAGERVRGAVRVVNRSSRGRVLRLESLDASTADTGGVWFPGGTPRSGGRWLSLERRDIRLGPRAHRTVRFTAQLPSAATTGEHYAGIVVTDRADLRRARRRTGKTAANRAGVKIEHITRLALPVRIVVPGPADRRLVVDNAEFAANASGTRIDLGLRNDGRRVVRSTAVDLAVSDPAGRVLFRHRARMPEFLPATAVRYPIAWRGTPAAGRYRLKGTIRPRGAAPIAVDREIAFTRKSARALQRATGDDVAAPGPGLPWPVIAVAVAALLIAVVSTGAYLRMRRRLHALVPAGPA